MMYQYHPKIKKKKCRRIMRQKYNKEEHEIWGEEVRIPFDITTITPTPRRNPSGEEHDTKTKCSNNDDDDNYWDPLRKMTTTTLPMGTTQHSCNPNPTPHLDCWEGFSSSLVNSNSPNNAKHKIKMKSKWNWITRQSFNLIVFSTLLLLSCSCTTVQGQGGGLPPLPPAGFLDFDNLPVTSFSCEGKVIGGYYADVETGCQMFHVCTLGQKDEIQDIKFLCLNGTVFDQETRVCERVDEVDCSKAEQFYDLNLDLYVPHVATPKPPEPPPPDLEEEDDFIRPVSTQKPNPPVVSTTLAPRPPPSRVPPTNPPPPPTTTKPPTNITPRHRISGHLSSPSPSPQSSNSNSGGGSNSNSNKGFSSSFNYYLKTPHTHIASGYNSDTQQSYIINHNSGEKELTSYDNQDDNNNQKDQDGDDSSSNNIPRKIPSGPKTIIYTSNSVSSSSTTYRPRISSSGQSPTPRPHPSTTTTTTPKPPSSLVLKPEEYEEQYADEYYDDELPLDYQDVQSASSSSSGSSSNTNTAYGRENNKPSSSYDYRDGRSTSGSLSSANANHNNYNLKSDRGGTVGVSSSSSSSSSKSSKVPNGIKSHVSVAFSSSKSTRSPPVVVQVNNKVIPLRPRISSTTATSTTTTTRRPSTFRTTTTTRRPTTTTTLEPEPYYYDDDYPDDAELQEQEQRERQQPQIIVKTPQQSSSTTLRSVSGTKTKAPLSSTSPSSKDLLREPEYYDDESEGSEPVNVNDHHFSHVDVPRIPYAKPNVPRVLVTNGKPFLPRLTRHIQPHSQFSKDLVRPQQPLTNLHEYYNENLQNHRIPNPYEYPFLGQGQEGQEMEFLRNKRDLRTNGTGAS